jgi:hypothetical protein
VNKTSSYNYTGPIETLAFADGSLGGAWAKDVICFANRGCTQDKLGFLGVTNGTLPDVFKAADGVMGLAPAKVKTDPKSIVSWLKNNNQIPEAAFWFTKKAATDPEGPSD